MNKADPVTVAVVKGAMESICDEMDQHLIRAALSPIIAETNDCAHGFYHATSGETIAQGRFGLPVFMANMQFTVQTIIRRAHDVVGGFRPGDVWIMNDPYSGGTHLNDVNVVIPIFVEGELFALISNTGHWMDIGGSNPGGWVPGATEIHQEGIIIPPSLLYDQGKINQPLVDMFAANVRLPDMILGDLAAMASSLAMGEERARAVIARYGVDTVRACLEEMIESSERLMRSYISEIADGVYECSDELDNDGIVDTPLPFRLRLTVKGSDIHMDFTGTSKAGKGPVNLSQNTTISSAYVALKHIFPDVPVNGGTFRPVTFTVPEGSIVSAQYPRPVSGYLEVVGKVIDLIFGALAPALPDRVPAPSFGTTGVVTVGGHHPHLDTYFVGVFPYPGGYGGTAESDGQVHGNTPQSMANFMSLEVSEHRYPLRFDEFAIREDSGGPGEHRGGCGTSYGFTAWSEMVTSVLGDRVDHPPFGVNGGGNAAPNEVRLRIDGVTSEPPMRGKANQVQLRPGDAVMVKSPGGAGFGDPLQRPLYRVLEDLNLGFISEASASEHYGAVIAGRELVAGRWRFTLDEAASNALRTSRLSGS